MSILTAIGWKTGDKKPIRTLSSGDKLKIPGVTAGKVAVIDEDGCIASGTNAPGDLNAEVLRAQGAEGILAGAIGSETSRAESVEATLATSASLASEASTRSLADIALQANITAEAGARASAVSNEASARAAGDLTNANAISEETGRAEAAEALKANASDLSAHTGNAAIHAPTAVNDTMLGHDGTGAWIQRSAAQLKTWLSLKAAAFLDVGTTTGTVAAGDDVRFSDARTPTTHASSHATTGSDPITPAAIGAATSAQGALADTALQPTGDGSQLTGLTESQVSGLVTDLAAKADLVSGTVPASQLPSYVDDVVEVANYAALPTTGETGKIYVTLDDNLTYRWGGTAYAEISKSLALGETSSTAYRGDYGKVAYDHSQLTTGNPHGTTTTDLGAVPTSRTVNGHALSADVIVTKSDVDLGNVDDTSDANKPVSTAQATAIGLKADLILAPVYIDSATTTALTITDAHSGKTLICNTTTATIALTWPVLSAGVSVAVVNIGAGLVTNTASSTTFDLTATTLSGSGTSAVFTYRSTTTITNVGRLV